MQHSMRAAKRHSGEISSKMAEVIRIRQRIHIYYHRLQNVSGDCGRLAIRPLSQFSFIFFLQLVFVSQSGIIDKMPKREEFYEHFHL